jgi:hypothetical protein
MGGSHARWTDKNIQPHRHRGRFWPGGRVRVQGDPAQAADLGGDCCADLEERVAELEATTVRKGNKKVSVTLSGWVVKTVNWWDDGDLSDTWVGDKDADLTSRFAITGSATIAPGWSAGYNITVTVPGSWAGDLLGADVFGIFSNQAFEDSTALNGINTLYSYMYVKSDKWGAINWGYLSPASDNAAVLADISGTVIETNAVMFEGPSFNLRAKGAASGFQGLVGVPRHGYGLLGHRRASKVHGPFMKDWRQHLMITAAEWEAFIDDLQQTLDKFAVPQAEQAEIKAIVASTRADIVV